jgi:transposase
VRKRHERAQRIAELRTKYEHLSPELDERGRRVWAAVEARSIQWGGVSQVVEATGLAKTTVMRGLADLDRPAGDGPRRVREPGGGRKSTSERDPKLLKALDALIEPTTRGDPVSPLRWTCKSTRRLAAELRDQGFNVSHETVAQLLRQQGYSLQSNRKTLEGSQHPDRDAQFRQINTTAKDFLERGQPVISVDTKKKELVGDFKNAGREWRAQGEPLPVRVHDFIDRDLGKAIPYGVYDVGTNAGFVNLGIDHDTPDFAVASIRAWWKRIGSKQHPAATELMITADGGGSNGPRCRAWKAALQTFANDTGLTLNVCHYPPGTSKWNKIEHRMFCHITKNWRGRPLETHEVILSLISNTSTAAGLTIQARLDTKTYPLGVKISKAIFDSLNIEPNPFHGDWNYSISPT